MLIQLCKVCMTALTVDLQDLSCHVRVGQSHMLHATGVGDAIVPSVHLELEAAPHCEWFSCCIHLRSACNESENEQGPNVHVNYYITGEQIWILCEPFMQKKSFRKNSREKQKSALCYPTREKHEILLQDVALLTLTDTVLLFFSAYPLRERILGPWKSSQSKVNSEGRAMSVLTRLVGCVCSSRTISQKSRSTQTSTHSSGSGAGFPAVVTPVFSFLYTASDLDLCLVFFPCLVMSS